MRWLLLLLTLASQPDPARAADLFVATNGSDAWSGTRAEPNAQKTDGPFASLERARDEVRKLKAAGRPGKGVTVNVREGVYSLPRTFALGAEDSGTERAPIVYRAFRSEPVTLSGGRELSEFAPHRGAVLKCSVKALGLDTLKPVTTDRFAGDVPAFELFFEGRRMDLARWPNARPSNPRGGEWSFVAQTPAQPSRTRFFYSGDRPARWAHPEEAQVHLFPWWDWFDQYVDVQSIDPAKREIVLSSPTGYDIQIGRRFYVRNVFEELDAPGEWYFDRRERVLYFYPPSSIEQAKPVVSVLDSLVKLRDARHVTLRGLTLEACRGTAVMVMGGSDNQVAGCTLRNTGMDGINIDGGVRNSAVGNDIYETGRGGIRMAGGDRKTLTSSEHRADNNHIHHFGRVLKCYQPALSINGVGCRVSHNLIHDGPHAAILLNGNDHVVEFNDIHHVCMETSDSGAFYTGRDWTYRGNVFRYNRLHDIYGYGFEKIDEKQGTVRYVSPDRAQGIYLDDGMSGFHIYGNVLYRVGDMMLQVGGGRDNLIENNLFIDGHPAIGVDARWPTYPWETHNVARLKEVPYQKPPWSTRYPELAKPMRNFRWPEGNRFFRNIVASLAPHGEGFLGFRYAVPPDAVQIDRNLVWNGGRSILVQANLLGAANRGSLPWDRWQREGFDRGSLNADPRFVDPASDNFQLRDDSPAYKLGFQRIPMEQIGLYRSPLRASWPVPPDSRRGSMERVVDSFPIPGFTPAPRQVAQFTVRRRSRPPIIDGKVDPEEWGGLDAASAMVLEEGISGARTEPVSRAWLSYDDDNLYLGIINEVDPSKPLSTGSNWGRDDAVEVAVRNPARAQPIIIVLRGFTNGYHMSTTEAGAPYEDVIRAENESRYAAKILDPGRWSAEWRIPFAVLGIDPDHQNRLDFNLTVRKTAAPLWLMWQGTGGNSWLLDNAGVILLNNG